MIYLQLSVSVEFADEVSDQFLGDCSRDQYHVFFLLGSIPTVGAAGFLVLGKHERNLLDLELISSLKANEETFYNCSMAQSDRKLFRNIKNQHDLC